MTKGRFFRWWWHTINVNHLISIQHSPMTLQVLDRILSGTNTRIHVSDLLFLVKGRLPLTTLYCSFSFYKSKPSLIWQFNYEVWIVTFLVHVIVPALIASWIVLLVVRHWRLVGMKTSKLQQSIHSLLWDPVVGGGPCELDNQTN